MNSIELFAGCGGLAYGVSQAGFRHDLVVELNSDCADTLTENSRPNDRRAAAWKVAKCDTRDIDFTRLGSVDLLSGGPPCQPFSIGGRHLGPNDPRNMWPEAVRAVREIRPKAFLFENVRGLLRPAFEKYLTYLELQLSYPHIAPKKHEDWETHLDRLQKHASGKRRRPSYRVMSRAINTADYGAPQKRHRAIVVGIDAEICEQLEFPAPTHSQAALAWSKHVTHDYWKLHGVRRIEAPSSYREGKLVDALRVSRVAPLERPWVTVRDAISDLPRARKTAESAEIAGHWQHPGARSYVKHTGSSLDEPAKALKAGDHGVPGGENALVDPKTGGVRYFTIREMARLQGLPDSYLITGTWKAATRQLGNAVPSTVSRYLAGAVKEMLREGQSRI